MKFVDKLNKKIPSSWAVASLTLALIASAFVSVVSLRKSEADSKGKAIVSIAEEDVLEALEAILRDDDKTPEKRIERALEMLDKAKEEPGRSRLPFDDRTGSWSPFSSPLMGDDWDPFIEMGRMRQNIDRIFNDSFSRMRGGAPSPFEGKSPTWSPQGEFEENKDAYIYRFDLPGVDKNELSIVVENGRLVIEGSRESSIEESNQDEDSFFREIRHGKFSRATALPSDVDVNGKIESKLENGVLTVTLPKLKNASKSPSKKIWIE